MSNQFDKSLGKLIDKLSSIKKGNESCDLEMLSMMNNNLIIAFTIIARDMLTEYPDLRKEDAMNKAMNKYPSVMKSYEFFQEMFPLLHDKAVCEKNIQKLELSISSRK
jgi:hypothetical protein